MNYPRNNEADDIEIPDAAPLDDGNINIGALLNELHLVAVDLPRSAVIFMLRNMVRTLQVNRGRLMYPSTCYLFGDGTSVENATLLTDWLRETGIINIRYNPPPQCSWSIFLDKEDIEKVLASAADEIEH